MPKGKRSASSGRSERKQAATRRAGARRGERREASETPRRVASEELEREERMARREPME